MESKPSKPSDTDKCLCLGRVRRAIVCLSSICAAFIAGATMFLESPTGRVARRKISFRAVRVQFKEGGDAYRLQIKYITSFLTPIGRDIRSPHLRGPFLCRVWFRINNKRQSARALASFWGRWRRSRHGPPCPAEHSRRGVQRSGECAEPSLTICKTGFLRPIHIGKECINVAQVLQGKCQSA